MNFIDTKIEDPQIIPPTADWSVAFQDESREIASEYKGGASRYGVLEQDPMDVTEDESQMMPQPQSEAPSMTIPPLPQIQDPALNYADPMHDTTQSHQFQAPGSTESIQSPHSSHVMYTPSQASFAESEQNLPPPGELQDCLTSSEETLFVQVFVEEVGLWMDSMDPYKHVCDPIFLAMLMAPVFSNHTFLCPR